MRISFFLLVVMACLSASSPSRAVAQVGPAAYIASINGSTAGARIVQGDDAFAPECGQLLFAGDRIVVDSPDVRIEVRPIGAPRAYSVTKENAPELGLIRASAPPTTLVANALHWLAQLMPRKQPDEEVSLNIRSPGAPIRLLPFGTKMQTIAAGKRDLHVAWEGGISPYTCRLVALLKDGQKVIIEKTSLQRPYVVLDEIEILPGQYSLEVESASTIAEGNVLAVPENAVPGLPLEIKDSGIPMDFAKLLYIAWLSKTQDGSWSFEAMQQAAEAGRTNPLVEKLFRRFETIRLSDSDHSSD